MAGGIFTSARVNCATRAPHRLFSSRHTPAPPIRRLAPTLAQRDKVQRMLNLCGSLSRDATGPNRDATGPNPHAQEFTDEVYLKMRGEAEAPFRSIRLLLFGFGTASAGVASLIATSQLIGALGGAPNAFSPQDATQTLVIDLISLAVCGYLTKRKCLLERMAGRCPAPADITGSR